MREDLNNMRENLSKQQQITWVLVFLMVAILILQLYFQGKKISEYKKKRDEAEDEELKAAFNKEVNKRTISLVLSLLVPVIIVVIIFGLG